MRRVIRGEKVPTSEKIVSFFEEHTDIIVKGRRDVQYGHKVFLTGGTSNLILACLIERGNLADSDRYGELIEQHREQFGRVPRRVSADGGFASRNNLAFAKGREVKDAVFAKKRGLTVIEMAKSAWVYKMLRNFRAGIEAGVSTLKRAFGLGRDGEVQAVCVEQHCLLQFAGPGKDSVGQGLKRSPDGGNDPLEGVVCLHLRKSYPMN